jgi:hypothetical protein
MGNISTKILARAYRQRPIVYLPIYRQITGSTTAGIMLSQLMYWHDKMGGKEFWKTDEEIRNETGLTIKELKLAKKRIKSLSFISIERKGVPCRTFYTIDEDGMNDCVIKVMESEQEETVPTSWAERDQLDSPKGTNCMGRKGPTNTYMTQDMNTDSNDEKTPPQEKEETEHIKQPFQTKQQSAPDVNKKR